MRYRYIVCVSIFQDAILCLKSNEKVGRVTAQRAVPCSGQSQPAGRGAMGHQSVYFGLAIKSF